MSLRRAALSLTLAALASGTAAQTNRIDSMRPDAPALAATGPHTVGVQTLTFTNPDQIDVSGTNADGPIPTRDRVITIELWYPAAPDTRPGGTYTSLLRDGTTSVTLHGQAARNALPATGAQYPLVILSHGYPGNRFLMSHLGENLASKGYVVASIDHPDSTYDDLTSFGSTLVNRPWDQRFVLDRLAQIHGNLGAAIDTNTTAVIGYSMGGYGALIYAGAGVTQLSTTYEWGAPQGLLERNMIGTESHASLRDPRVRAFIAIGPWGMNTGFWDADGLSGIEAPLMLIAGGADDVSQYSAIREIFEGTSGTTRHLLTFDAANHNAAAPIPAPIESYAFNDDLGWSPFDHYADAVWDTVRMNNITQHFATAFLDHHLKGADTASYLALTPNAADGIWSADADGTPDNTHTYWQGFPNRTAIGLRFETREAGN